MKFVLIYTALAVSLLGRRGRKSIIEEVGGKEDNVLERVEEVDRRKSIVELLVR